MHATPSARREELRRLLGDLPDRAEPPTATEIGEVAKGNFMLETLVLDLNGIEEVPAYVLLWYAFDSFYKLHRMPGREAAPATAPQQQRSTSGAARDA